MGKRNRVVMLSGVCVCVCVCGPRVQCGEAKPWCGAGGALKKWQSCASVPLSPARMTSLANVAVFSWVDSGW